MIENKRIRFKDNLWYLVYWPVYLIAFSVLEFMDEGKTFHLVHSFVDDLIPFNEFFVIPYLTWHVLIPLTLIYTLLNETENFRKLMKFFILTFTVTMIIYIAYPTYLELRPATFPRENIFTEVVRFIYWIDTPTNVCPSLHITGSLGLLFASWDTRGRDSVPKKVFMALAVVFICLSTMFLKQHSFVDILVAIPISFVGWLLCFRSKEINDLHDIINSN